MKITVELSGDDAMYVNRVIALANLSGDNNTHGPLDVKTLIQMLLEDVALVIRRPGSWEGASMAQLLTSHGYEI